MTQNEIFGMLRDMQLSGTATRTAGFFALCTTVDELRENLSPGTASDFFMLAEIITQTKGEPDTAEAVDLLAEKSADGLGERIGNFFVWACSYKAVLENLTKQLADDFHRFTWLCAEIQQPNE